MRSVDLESSSKQKGPESLLSLPGLGRSGIRECQLAMASAHPGRLGPRLIFSARQQQGQVRFQANTTLN
jgi:hypothetical protein